MLQGDDTTPASPAQTEGQPIEQQSDEEVEFNSLSGSAQERVRELVRRAREAELEKERLSSQHQNSYVPPAPNTLAPDQRQAIETLSQFGIATDDKVEKKVAETFNQIRWEMENQRLASKYAGSNGEPQYVREEVEDYIRNHPQYSGYAPEDVFRYKMYPDEISRWESESKGTPQRSRTSSFRPTKSQSQSSNAITPENVEEMVKSHDQDWYDEHIEEINKAVAQHTGQFRNKDFGV